MLTPVEIAKIFLNTFDGRGRQMFLEYLAKNPHVTKWMIAADFCLHDPHRPVDCMAFSLIPYDDELDEIFSDVAASLPKDLKKCKDLSPEAVVWLRDNRRFHVVVSLNKLRNIFYDCPTSDTRAVAREHIEITIESMTSSSGQGVLTRFKKLRRKSLAKTFNVDLLSDIYILSTLFAVLTVIIGRDRRSEIIGWFPDRDKMTNWCDSIWYDYAIGNTGALCDHFNINMTSTKIAAAEPDRSGESEIIWFDCLIRGADWFAGSIGAWDRALNQIRGQHSKYRQMLEDVVADAQNIVCLHGDFEKGSTSFWRLLVSRTEAPSLDLT